MNEFFSAPDGRGRGTLRRHAPRRTGGSGASLALVVALVVVLGLAAPPAVAAPDVPRAVAALDVPRAGNPPVVATRPAVTISPAIVTQARVVPPAVTPPIAAAPPAVAVVTQARVVPPAVTPPIAAVVADAPSAVAGSRSSFLAEWSWPLSPEPRVLRRFERPPQRWKPGHRGVDLATEGPAAVVGSPADGVVSFAGTVVDRGVLSIDHGDGRVSSFEPVSTTLVKGQAVRKGDPVATVALPRPPGTGVPARAHCGEGCLHWGVRVEGEYVDPLAFVTDRRPSVLLPFNG